MAQKLGEWGLKKKFTINKLQKVGGVYFRPSKSGGKIISGVQRGANLKKTLIDIAKGKTPYTFSRELQFKYGVAGSQAGKRREIIDLIEGGKKNGLTKEQVKRNLNFAKRERIDEAETISKGENYSKRCIGINDAKPRGITKKAGFNIEEAGVASGFAGDYKNSKIPDNPTLKSTPSDAKPAIKLAV